MFLRTPRKQINLHIVKKGSESRKTEFNKQIKYSRNKIVIP